jgi:hypothetical protein
MTFKIFCHYFWEYAQIMKVDWDLDTITVSDFAVEMDIQKDAYKQWYKKEYKDQYKISRKRDNVDVSVYNKAAGEAFKDTLIEQIEANLKDSAMNSKKRDDSYKNEQSKMKVADIIFAYDNAELIDLLRKRGKAIQTLKFGEVEKLEFEITSLKDRCYEQLTIPVCAFITFEYDDS